MFLQSNPPKIPLYNDFEREKYIRYNKYTSLSKARGPAPHKAASLVGEIHIGRRIQRLMISKLESDLNLSTEEMRRLRSCYCKQHATNNNFATFHKWDYPIAPVNIQNIMYSMEAC